MDFDAPGPGARCRFGRGGRDPGGARRGIADAVLTVGLGSGTTSPARPELRSSGAPLSSSVRDHTAPVRHRAPDRARQESAPGLGRIHSVDRAYDGLCRCRLLQPALPQGHGHDSRLASELGRRRRISPVAAERTDALTESAAPMATNRSDSAVRAAHPNAS